MRTKTDRKRELKALTAPGPGVKVTIADRLDPGTHSKGARKQAGKVGRVVRVTRRGMVAVVFAGVGRHLFSPEAVS